MALRSLKHEFPWHGGETKPTGQAAFQVMRKPEATRPKPESLPSLLLRVWRQGLPHRGLSSEINRWRFRNIPNLWRGLRKIIVAHVFNVAHFQGELGLTIVRANGEVVQLGMASLRVITTAGVGFIVDAFQGIVEPEIMKYHALGTGGTAEAVGDTALVTELTTQYVADNTRATGSLTEGAGANIFRTLGTNTVDASAAITEHGLISQAAVGGGVLLDRSLFSVINLASGDSLASTWDGTFSAGG